MKKRILTGWTVRRAIYFIFGIIIIANGFIDGQWPLVLFGAYFAAMGLLSFGCARGQCDARLYVNKKARTDEVEFEELK
jgi:hypothetical protein